MTEKARNFPRFPGRNRPPAAAARPARGAFTFSIDGSLMPIGAAVILVVTVAGFAALDFQNSTMLRSNLQDSLDAATLAVARSTETNPSKLDQLGKKLLEQSLHKSADGATLKNVKFREDKGVMYGDATAAFSPLLAGFFTGKQVEVGAKSKVAPGDSLEIAMVLDNTYSMYGTRIATLKTAATNFVDILEDAAAMSRDPNALKISLVPFATTVNVGSAYRYAAWMDTTALSPVHAQSQMFSGATNRFTLLSQMGTTWAGCVESRPAPYDVQDTAPTVGTPATLFVPYFAPDEPDDWFYSDGSPKYGWVNNYVPDEAGSTWTWQQRQTYLGKYDQAPKTSAIGNGYNHGPNYECTLKPLQRLTTDGTKVKNAIANLTVTGDTNIPMGLAWGWHTLSPNAPFKDGSAYGKPKTKKIVVLMTDGQNASYNGGSPNKSIYSGIAYITQNRIGITGGTALERRAAMDARLSLLCKNMKAKNILIYTIRLEVNDTNYAVLRDCATTPAMFFDVKQASELTSTFSKIAQDIQKLRIAQ